MPPLGYRCEAKRLAIEEPAAETNREMFLLDMSGNSLRAIAERPARSPESVCRERKTVAGMNSSAAAHLNILRIHPTWMLMDFRQPPRQSCVAEPASMRAVRTRSPATIQSPRPRAGEQCERTTTRTLVRRSCDSVPQRVEETSRRGRQGSAGDCRDSVESTTSPVPQ